MIKTGIGNPRTAGRIRSVNEIFRPATSSQSVDFRLEMAKNFFSVLIQKTCLNLIQKLLKTFVLCLRLNLGIGKKYHFTKFALANWHLAEFGFGRHSKMIADLSIKLIVENGEQAKSMFFFSDFVQLLDYICA